MSDDWEDASERDHAALALVTSVLEDDTDLMAAVLGPIDREQVVALAVTIASWFAWAMTEANLDPREHVQRVAMDLARRASGLDPDNG